MTWRGCRCVVVLAAIVAMCLPAALRAQTAPIARVRMAPAVKALLEKAPAWREAIGRLGYAPDLVGDASLHGARAELERSADER